MLPGGAYRALGRDSDGALADRRCLERAERELERQPDNARAAYCGALALISTGEPERARQWAERALWIDPEDYLVLYNLACVHARLGEPDQALELLARSLERANPKWMAYARNDSDLDSLRDDPRFEALLQASGG